jgi:hypothetical protein
VHKTNCQKSIIIYRVVPQISVAVLRMRRVLTADYSGEKCPASALRGESDFIRDPKTFTLNDPRICSASAASLVAPVLVLGLKSADRHTRDRVR